jgi:hypothetical protein
MLSKWTEVAKHLPRLAKIESEVCDPDKEGPVFRWAVLRTNDGDGRTVKLVEDGTASDSEESWQFCRSCRYFEYDVLIQYNNMDFPPRGLFHQISDFLPAFTLDDFFPPAPSPIDREPYSLSRIKPSFIGRLNSRQSSSASTPNGLSSHPHI